MATPKKKRCLICNFYISKTNWSKHIKSKKHLEKEKKLKEKYCFYCDIVIQDDKLFNHLRSSAHKEKVKRLKKHINAFNIRKQQKRHIDDIKFETDDYIVKKSEEALEKCFLTLRVIPKGEVSTVDVLIVEIPDLMFEMIKNIVTCKSIKLQLVLSGEFLKFNPATGKEEFQEMVVPSKNKIIMREGEIKSVIHDLLYQIKEAIESWDNNEGYWHLKRVIYIDFKLREYKAL